MSEEEADTMSGLPPRGHWHPGGHRRNGGRAQSVRASGTEKRNILQKVIFTRFLEQRLRQSGGGNAEVVIKDIVADLADGTLLIKIVECLSGKTRVGKPLKPQKMRILQINQAGVALNWVKEQGIDFKCSPEDLVDGQAMFILGMIFKIIIKYMKLDEDDEESADVKEALRLWVLNKVQGYDVGDSEMKTLTRPFHNGLIFCALIHKMRPKLIDFASLDKAKGKDNLELALDVAEKYCNVQRYISVDDISALDELGMVVYVYDWYYGISLLAKQDNAARRIGKLADMTKLHDEMKADFDGQVLSLMDWITKKSGWLAGRDVSNTMAGIKKQLEIFYTYKTEEKAAKLVLQMDIGAVFDNLALRLHNNKRPAYTAPITVEQLEEAFVALAQAEAEASKFMQAEMSRQNNLLRIATRVTSECAQFTEWLQSAQTALAERPAVSTIDEAEMAVESHVVLEEANKANMTLRSATIDKYVTQLVTENYEDAAAMTAAKVAVAGVVDTTNAQSAAKKAWAAAELEAQHKINDALCKAFADAAMDFETWLKSSKDATSKGAALEAQLAAVEAVLADNAAVGKLEAIAGMVERITARQIHINPYTQVTEQDLVSSSKQFTTSCEKRKKLLNDEIRRRDQSGITDEQIKEVNDNFDYFDKDKSGALDKREMRMCLQSLGEEMTPANVKAIIANYDKDGSGSISRDEFREYMLTKIGDTDTAEEILAGFGLLSLDGPAVALEQLEAVVNDLTFKDHHVAYLKQNMAAVEGGLDHVTWTGDVFAR